MLRVSTSHLGIFPSNYSDVIQPSVPVTHCLCPSRTFIMPTRMILPSDTDFSPLSPKIERHSGKIHERPGGPQGKSGGPCSDLMRWNAVEFGPYQRRALLSRKDVNLSCHFGRDAISRRHIQTSAHACAIPSKQGAEGQNPRHNVSS